MSGVPPRVLRQTPAKLIVPAGVQDDIAASLRTVVERSERHSLAGSMISRQARYLLTDHAPSSGWLAARTTLEPRKVPDLSAWSPSGQWRVRLQSPPQRAGNLDPLLRFVEGGLSTEAGMDAN